LVADFRNQEELKRVIENSNLQFHILINNTGGQESGAILDLADQFQQSFCVLCAIIFWYEL
jgi:3-oxoacyl-[acyl-carrier protein] reductase